MYILVYVNVDVEEGGRVAWEGGKGVASRVWVLWGGRYFGNQDKDDYFPRCKLAVTSHQGAR